MTVNSILDKARGLLLQREPARAIGYGAALVIVGVVAVSNALGFSRFGENISLEGALVAAGTATTTVVSIVEFIRKLVYSPATVAEVVTNPPTASGPIEAAIDAGVQPEVIADAGDRAGDST